MSSLLLLHFSRTKKLHQDTDCHARKILLLLDFLPVRLGKIEDALFLLLKFLSVEIQLRDATRISCHLWFLHVIKILGT